MQPAPHRRFRLPDTLVIVGALAIGAWAATWLAVPGRFAVAGDPPRIVPGSFAPESAPEGAPLFGSGGEVGLLNLLFEGLVTGARDSATVGLAAFLLVVGGAFGVIARTGAIDRLVAGAAGRGALGPGTLALFFGLFSLAGAVFGLSEEAVAFTLILTPALARAGYGPPVAVAVCYGASQVGFASSWMSPFTVLVAQSIAGLPPLSGLELRAALFVVMTALGMVWIARFARARRSGPAAAAAAAPYSPALPGPAAADYLILALVLAAVGWVAWGVSARGWFLPEIAAQFLALGIAAALVGVAAGRFPDGLSGAAAAFRDGAADMVPAVLVIGMAKGMLLLLGGTDPAAPSLMNSLLDAVARGTAWLPEWLTALGMFAAQTGINFLITSGSGQAAVTMPLMAPLADLSGVTRQTAVLAFQLGAGLTDLVSPTSAALMGCLAAARLQFGTWLRAIWRPLTVLYLVAAAAIVGAHLIGYQ